ncbi:MAG TPA: branched-chain amino acid ABC transporter substrate-binding protein [Micropruina sp.]|nr:branched-chain amino acid ABC transporter substrate-binding protein [Propionibacterium sp.]HMQ37004.1 branched-chain amino acid ABC transporter substrate-binding protein [Micropruina sp.]HMR21131.1 branched-chain amino acid ABC transporter substrate-binding protein [Micropruina sp.]
MRNKKLLGGAAALLSASLLFTACGSRTEPGTGSTDGATKTAKIGVIAPLTGDLSVMGLGIKNSVDLAIKQANDSNAIPGWKLELAAEDDQATADVGANAATKLAADDQVIGVVGTLNSGVAQPVQPILNDAKIVMVSPANTSPNLTQGADLTKPSRTYAGYFRVCTTDAIQGPFAAQYLFESGIKKLAVVHDKKPYGQGLAGAVAKKFTELGGDVVASETVNKDDKDFSTVIDLVKAKSPQAVYFGTEFQLAGPMSKQMKDKGLNVPLMGGDGIYDAKFISLAGAKSDGDLATSVGAPIESLASGKSYVDAYKAAGYSDGYSAYGAYAYDAANAIIAALKTSLASATDAKSARQATIDAIASVSFDGATGKVGFDQYGDAITKTLTVYVVEGGKWVPKQTGELK